MSVGIMTEYHSGHVFRLNLISSYINTITYVDLTIQAN